MSYVDQQLAPGEKVMHRTKLHWILFVGPAVLTVIFVLLAVSTRTGLWVFLAFVTGLLLVGRFLLLRTSEFAVTNKRVLIKVGVLRHRSLELLLTKVEALSVDQPLLGRMLNYGNLTIGGTGGTKEVFKQIEAPQEFRRRVQQHSGT